MTSFLQEQLVIDELTGLSHMVGVKYEVGKAWWSTKCQSQLE
jgi:hypothetical protein